VCTKVCAWAGFLLMLFLADLSAAEAPRLKGQLMGVVGAGIDSITRAEGWMKHMPSYLDLKLKFEQRDGSRLKKYRLQFLPLQLGYTASGLAYRYQKKEGTQGVDALGLAIRARGTRWVFPARYYPEIHLFHSKPVYRHGKIYTDCQITYDVQDNEGSIRPGVDWHFTRYFSAGGESRIYTDSDRNYIGIRLKLTARSHETQNTQ